MLFSARIQFAPELQPYRDQTVDRLVERSLLVGDVEGGLNLYQVERQRPLSLGNGSANPHGTDNRSSVISSTEVQASLNRLVERDRLIKQNTDFGPRYRLSQQVLEELLHLQRVEEDRFANIVSVLFRDAPNPSEQYADAFFECLCVIFGKLGESYVQVLLGKTRTGDFLGSARISQGIEAVRRLFPIARDIHFDRAVRRFFGENQPEFDAIKWKLAQNYYLAKALGLDEGGKLLSGEIYGNAQFYLDTNVVFQAIEPRMQRHRSFSALIAAGQKLNIQVSTCQISLDEMRNAVSLERELILKVEDRIPDALAMRVRRNLYEIYLDEKHKNGSVDITALFEDFINPMPILRDQYQIELVDDVWFSTSVNDKRVQDLVQQIQRLAEQRQKPKRRGTAQHDALLLAWVQNARESGQPNVWLVTLDTLLPSISLTATNPNSVRPRVIGSTNQQERPLAITLDALLQWISPLVPFGTEENEIAAIFSEAVKYQLLPQDGFFDLKDFRVFAELDISTRELPVEDVEDCLLYLRSNASHLDPSKPQDLQQLGLEIQRFFADPGRKYQRNLSILEEANVQREQDLQRERQERLRVEEDLRREKEEEVQRERQLAEARVAAKEQEYENRITAIKKEHEEQSQRRESEQLKRSARRRLMLCAVLFLLITGGAIVLTVIYGDQSKAIMDRLTGNKEVLGAVLISELVLFAFILGRKGLQALDFPGWEIWKNNNK